MWFYEQISGNKVVEPQAADESAANKDAAVEQTNTYELTSGDEDSSTGSSATPVAQPAAKNKSEEEFERQPDEGIEVLHYLSTPYDHDAHSKASSTISKSTTRSKSGSVEEESVKEASSSRRSLATADDASQASQKSLSLSTSADMVKSSRNISVEEEKGAIEVEAAGVGFALSSWEDIKDGFTVLTANGSDDDASSKSTNKKRRSRVLTRKCKMAIIAFAVITALCLVALLAFGVSKNLSKSKKSALVASTLEEEDPASAVDPSTTQATDEPNVTSTFAPPSNATQASPPVRQDDKGEDTPGWWDGQETDTENSTVPPTFAQTAASTTAGTSMPTDISCGDDHNLLVGSECQSDGVESWTSTRVLFCFSRTRDGDWYWIRSADDGDYDRWDYTEGESEGMVEVESIPAGEYLVSLVRDSMQPYDILLTETVSVPDCSSASA